MAEDQEFTLPPLEERPLVTFALFAYNQEKYIREAVEGAFAQTYEPLEIILSDDCSTDRTFEIMEEMAAGYSGRHRVRATRNFKNMGIAAHVHKIDSQATGALIVHAAGDDISLPHRTTQLVRHWLSFDKGPSVIVSNAETMTPEGITDGTVVGREHENCWINGKDNTFYSVLGCSLAVEKSLIEKFGPIDERIIAEDVVLYRRAEVSNGIFYIKEPLVKWRRHNASVTHSGVGGRERYLAWEKRWATDTLRRIAQAERDRSTINLSGSGYPITYTTLIHLKVFALESNLLLACAKLSFFILSKRINKLDAREIAKIILVRLRLITPKRLQ